MTYQPQRALELLRLGAGSAAVFRDGQEEAIRHLVEGKGRLLIYDMVDSRWAITVSGWLLRSHACGEAWLLALAMTARG